MQVAAFREDRSGVVDARGPWTDSRTPLGPTVRTVAPGLVAALWPGRGPGAKQSRAASRPVFRTDRHSSLHDPILEWAATGAKGNAPAGIALDNVFTVSTISQHDEVRHDTTGTTIMRRGARRLGIDRVLGRRGTLRRRIAGVAGGLTAAAAVVFGFAVLADVISFETPACETATPTLPDYQAAPFAFDPEARAYAFVQAMADDDFQAAYSMLAYFPESGATPCDYVLEDLWDAVSLRPFVTFTGRLLSIRPAAIVGL